MKRNPLYALGFLLIFHLGVSICCWGGAHAIRTSDSNAISSPQDLWNIPLEVTWSTAPLSAPDQIPFTLYFTNDKGKSGQIGLEDKGQIWAVGKGTSDSQVGDLLRIFNHWENGWMGNLKLGEYRIMPMGPSGPEGDMAGILKMQKDTIQVLMYNQRTYFPSQFRLFISGSISLTEILATIETDSNRTAQQGAPPDADTRRR